MPDGSVSTAIELAQAAQGATGFGGPVGRVENVVGRVTLTRADGTQVNAETGSPIYQGDKVDTAVDGKIGILFADNSVFSVGEKGSMVIDEMVYDPGANTGKSAIKVVEGVFSFVSGQIAKTGPDAMTISTPVSTIGIRGSAGAGKAGPSGTANSFSLLPDSQGTGEVTITTQTGSITLNIPYQTTVVSSAYAPPNPPVILSPALVAKIFGAVQSALPSVPGSGTGTGGTGGGTTGATGGGATSTGTTGQGATNQGATNQAQGNDAVVAEVSRQAEAASLKAFEAALAQGASLDKALGAAIQTAVGAAVIGAEIAAGKLPANTNLTTAIDSLVTYAVSSSVGTGSTTQTNTGSGPFGTPTPGAGNNTGLSSLGVSFGSDKAGDGKGSDGAGKTDAGTFNISLGGFTPQQTSSQKNDPGPGDDPSPQQNGQGNGGGGSSGSSHNVINMTSGNDVLVGTSGIDSFFMSMDDSTMGGIDTISGGNGDDILTFDGLSSMAIKWTPAGSPHIQYSNGGSVTGTMTLNSIETVQANNDKGTVEVGDGVSSGDIFIFAGGGGNDTLEIASGTEPISNSGITIGSGGVADALVFGGAGGDTITIGENYPATTSYNATVYGGDGADTVRLAAPATVSKLAAFGGNPDGTDNSTSDKLLFAPAVSSANYDFTGSGFSFSGFEILQTSNNAMTIKAKASFFSSITTFQGNQFTTIAIDSGTLNLSSKTDSGNVISTIGQSSVSQSVTLIDFGDSVGRSLQGGSANDSLSGGGGADTFRGEGGNDRIDLGNGDGANDSVVFNGSGTNGMDTLVNFGASDKMIIGNFGLNGAGGTSSATSYQLISSHTTAANTGTTVIGIDSSFFTLDNSLTDTAQKAAMVTAFGNMPAGSAFRQSLGADDVLALLVQTTTGNTTLWHFNNASGGGSDANTVESSELTKMATLESTSVSSLSSSNFANNLS